MNRREAYYNRGRGSQWNAPGSCPYSDERLHELYWRELRSAREIGELAGVTESAAFNWLRKANITIRTISETRKAEIKRFGAKKMISRIGDKRHSANPWPKGKKQLRSTIKAMREGHKRYYAAMAVWRVCQYCGKDFSVLPKEIRRGGGKCCSRRCGVLKRWRGQQVFTEEEARAALGI